MAIKPEVLEQWLEDHSVENRQKEAHKNKEHLRRKAERRKELIDKLLSESWGRELWYDIIAECDVLKLNPMTGNAQSYYIMGLQHIPRGNMDWVKRFHFESWIKMEQEARAREMEAQHGRERN